MPTTVHCPACSSRLRLPDDLAGRDVRCPRCDAAFAAPDAPPDDPGPPDDLPLELVAEAPPADPTPAGFPGLKLSLDDAAPRQPVPPPPSTEPWRPGRVPPALNDEHDDLQTCPACGRHAHRDAARCPACGERFGGGPEGPRRAGRTSRRRAVEPHRGGVVLALGITGLCLTAVPVVGAVLGLIAWVLGQGDLRKQRNGRMDPEGSGLTRAGWVCGIIATGLNGLLTLACCGFVTVGLLAEKNSRPPRPAVREWGPGDAPVPPPRRPGRGF